MRKPALLFFTSCIFTGVFAKSILFEHGTIISFGEENQQLEVIRNGSLLITDDRVAGIFPSSGNNATAIPPDTERISADGDIITPASSTLIDIPGRLLTYLVHWANTTLTSEVYDRETMYYSELMGLCEGLNSGVTTIVDYATGSITEEATRAGVAAMADSGVRGTFGFPMSSAHSNFTLEDQMALWQELATQQESARSLVSMGLVYETFDIGAPEEIQAIIDFARTSNISLLGTHFVGGPIGTANSPTLLASLSLLNSTFPITFVHGNGLTPTDAVLLRTHNHYVAHAPVFEAHHGSNFRALAHAADQASLSAGSPASQSPDLLGEMRAWLQQVRTAAYEDAIADRWRVPANNPASVRQAFLLATRAGGLALRRPELGVLRVGAKADVVVFDGTAPGVLGWADAVAAVVMHAGVGDIKHVLVDGEWRKRDGELRCGGEGWQVVRARFLQAAQRLQAFFEGVPRPELEGGWFGGMELERLEEVDALRGPGKGY
ncbi:amidohydrolase [Macrophomina phaseolina]|uniref:Amidohydrolase n=1 Tax=Macrophomina phaseolina TaxID=35725 RepID=A0ABQ8GVZ6_9PEZI|nr:amidohydrolase [Macrophomina phaseolina]